MKTIDIENYFTEQKEREGVWHEPVIDGVPVGLEFLLIGIHAEEAVAELEKIDEQSEAVKNSELSDEEKLKKLEEFDVERVAVLTKNIRAKNGAELVLNGEPVKFSTEFMKQFYTNCPSIKIDNIDFVLKSANFMILE